MIAPKNKIMIKNTAVTQKYGDYEIVTMIA